MYKAMWFVTDEQFPALICLQTPSHSFADNNLALDDLSASFRSLYNKMFHVTEGSVKQSAIWVFLGLIILVNC